MSEPLKIAITGAAGQIGYALLFRIAAGGLLGAKQPLSLHLLEVEAVLPALDGVEMELRDGAFESLFNIVKTADAEVAFGDADIIFLVGARARGPGMERKDLLEANAAIFSAQGKALNQSAKKSAKILVVGNPANTNCLIARHNAPDLPDTAFSAMTRLDQNRALAQLAEKSGQPVATVSRAIIWGNHSATQYPDIHHALIDGKPALSVVDDSWYRNEMIPTVQQRGAAVIKARGASSAASAASAALDHMRDWVCGQDNQDDYCSMALLGSGQYGIQSDVLYSYPARCENGAATIIDGLEMNDFSVEKMRDSEKELLTERDSVRHLLP